MNRRTFLQGLAASVATLTWGEPEIGVGPVAEMAPQPLTTRTRYQVSQYESFIRDSSRIAVKYDVRGRDDTLVLFAWIAHELAGDSAVVENVLTKLDEEAEWAAAHPDEIPTAELMWM